MSIPRPQRPRRSRWSGGFRPDTRLMASLEVSGIRMRIKERSRSMRLTAIRSLGLCALITFGVATIHAAAEVHFTATTENVSGAGESIKINLTSWSTDMQRDELVTAWNLT